MDPAELKAKILADPYSLGSVALWNAGDNQGVANLFNYIDAQWQVDVAYRDAWELQGACAVADLAAITADKRELWTMILIAGRVEVRNAAIRDQITTIWAGCTATLQALGALQTRDGTWAEAEWGDGTVVSVDDVRAARNA